MPKGLRGFQKGNKLQPKFHSEITKAKIRKSRLGKHYPKLSEATSGKNHHGFGIPRTEEMKRKNRLANIGKSHPSIAGSNHPNWKGGITPLRIQIRLCFKYRKWTSDIFIRDNFTCQNCGKRGGNLEVHHLKQYALILKINNIKTLRDALECKELWDISNGKTLCKSCHRKTFIFMKRFPNKIETGLTYHK